MSSICSSRSGRGRAARPGSPTSDLDRAQRQRHHVERDAERLDALLQPRQPVDRPGRVELRRGQPAADVVDAEAGQHAEDRVGVAVLCSDFHPRGRERSGARREPGARWSAPRPRPPRRTARRPRPLRSHAENRDVSWVPPPRENLPPPPAPDLAVFLRSPHGNHGNRRHKAARPSHREAGRATEPSQCLTEVASGSYL